MSFAAEQWPRPAGATGPIGTTGPTGATGPGGTTGPTGMQPRHGVLVVWLVELAKMMRLLRVQAIIAACVLAPFGFALAVSVQSALPQDTLFGQWLRQSGLALPMVLLSFAGQWCLPLLASIVAGDIFSSEDHLGTWKTVLTRSRTRGQVFAGKVLAAVSACIGALVLLALSSLLAGLTLGTHAVVGLTGQIVPAGHGVGLVLASWASQLPPMLGFAALAVLLSVASRTSAVGMGGPVLLGLAMQLSALISLPLSVRTALLSTSFGGWHGLWVQPSYAGPLLTGVLVSAGWFVVCGAAAWMVFRRRSMAVS